MSKKPRDEHALLPELFRHPLEAPSVFTPKDLLDAVRLERGLLDEPVPQVCILEFDGDLTDWLVAKGMATSWPSWACFHTRMYSLNVDGQPVGIVARTIGGPYAVLIAEQLAASGAQIILGLTSAGRVSPDLPIPSLVLAQSAVRDEGTSFHYLPPARKVDGDFPLIEQLRNHLSGLSLPIACGTVWTTDAPYRETAEQLSRHSSEGVLAVEMQAASLLAFGGARGVRCGVVAYVTNGIGHSSDEQFNKGAHEIGLALLEAMARGAFAALEARGGLATGTI